MEDTCYYCGEPYEAGEPCSEFKDGRPHESQAEFDEQMRKLQEARDAQFNDLQRKVDALKETSDGCAL